MSIMLTLIPYNPDTDRYDEDNKIPFQFGVMTEEYYYNTTSELTEETNKNYYHNFGYYTDNVLVQGSNIIGKLTSDAPLSSFNIPESEFKSGTGNYYQTPSQKYKIYTEPSFPDDVYMEVIERLFLASTSGDGKADIRYSITVNITSTNVVFKSYHFPYAFTNETIIKGVTYQEFLSLNGGSNLGSWVARQGYVYGVNAYPYVSEDVEASLTTTGCIIQAYCYSPTASNIFTTSKLYTDGYNGTVVRPQEASYLTDNDKFVPYLLNLAYETKFPESIPSVNIGSYDNGSGSGDFPSLPMQSAIASGMVKMYQMDTSQINEFADFLWNANLFEDWDTVVTTLKQGF